MTPHIEFQIMVINLNNYRPWEIYAAEHTTDIYKNIKNLIHGKSNYDPADIARLTIQKLMYDSTRC